MFYGGAPSDIQVTRGERPQLWVDTATAMAQADSEACALHTSKGKCNKLYWQVHYRGIPGMNVGDDSVLGEWKFEITNTHDENASRLVVSFY